MNSAFDSRHFEDLLDEALEALAAGEQVEDILARYPDAADALRPVLETYAALAGVRLSPDRQAQAASRREFLAEAEQLAAAPLAGRPAGMLLRRAFSLVAGLALVVFLFGTVLVMASASALPGDALHPLKTTVEQIRLSLANDPAAFRRELADRRMAELVEMLETGRDGELELLGFVEALAPDTLVLNGRELPLAGATGTELIAVGDEVAVFIQITDCAIRVLEIRLLVPGELPGLPTPLPGPSPTTDMQSSSTPSPRTALPASPTPSPTSTNTGTPTFTQTTTPAPSPTSTPSPYSTQTATPTETPAGSTAPPTATAPGPGEDTPEPAETEEPENTPEPTETEEPDDTPEPSRTDEPENTPEPTETDEPDNTPEPSRTDEPDDPPEPTETDEP
jgi:hypothetical protein